MPDRGQVVSIGDWLKGGSGLDVSVASDEPSGETGDDRMPVDQDTRDWTSAKLGAAEARTASAFSDLRADLRGALADIKADMKIAAAETQALRGDVGSLRSDVGSLRAAERSTKHFVVGTGIGLAALIIALFGFGFQVLGFAQSLIQAEAPHGQAPPAASQPN